MKHVPKPFASQRGFAIVQFIILSTLVSHGINFGMQYFQEGLNRASSPATADGGEGIEALKALKRLALQEKKTPLVITPEEMKELVATVQILQHDGKYACPANFQDLAQDPLFSKAFGIRVLNDGGMVPEVD